MRFLTQSKRNKEDNLDFADYTSHDIADRKALNPFEHLCNQEHSLTIKELINFVHQEQMAPKEKQFFSLELGGYSKSKIMSVMSITSVSYYAYRRRCRSRIKNHIHSNNISLNAQ
jgi:hypothetical protein